MANRIIRHTLLALSAAFVLLLGAPRSSGLAAVEETAVVIGTSYPCYDCWKARRWIGGTYCDIYEQIEFPNSCVWHHQLKTYDTCGSWNTGGDEEEDEENLASTPVAPAEAKVVLVGDEGESVGCVRCGLTAECHDDWQRGNCHRACGTEVYWSGPGRVKLHNAIRIADAAAIAELIQGAKGLYLNTSRASIQISSCDGKSVVDNIPIKPELMAAVEIALTN